MWKRILAWQLKQRPDAANSRQGQAAEANGFHGGGYFMASVAMTADMNAQKAGVAVQRELAKLMW